MEWGGGGWAESRYSWRGANNLATVAGWVPASSYYTQASSQEKPNIGNVITGKLRERGQPFSMRGGPHTVRESSRRARADLTSRFVKKRISLDFIQQSGGRGVLWLKGIRRGDQGHTPEDTGIIERVCAFAGTRKSFLTFAKSGCIRLAEDEGISSRSK